MKLTALPVSALVAAFLKFRVYGFKMFLFILNIFLIHFCNQLIKSLDSLVNESFRFFVIFIRISLSSNFQQIS